MFGAFSHAHKPFVGGLADMVGLTLETVLCTKVGRELHLLCSCTPVLHEHEAPSVFAEAAAAFGLFLPHCCQLQGQLFDQATFSCCLELTAVHPHKTAESGYALTTSALRGMHAQSNHPASAVYVQVQHVHAMFMPCVHIICTGACQPC